MPNNTIQKIDEALAILSAEKTIEAALSLASFLLQHMGTAGIKSIDSTSADFILLTALKLPNAERYDHWFQAHPKFKSDRACFALNDIKQSPVEAKLYALKTKKKLYISGAAHFTPNFEDALFTRQDPNAKIGIDFFLPPANDSLLVVVSNNKSLRVVELKDRLTNTQKDILAKWSNVANLEREQLHLTIWDSFKLKSINEAFYKGIANSFKDLVSHLETNGKSSNEARHFANRLHGRLLFCWFLDKKGFINREANYFDTTHADATQYYKDKLELLFFDTLNTPQNERERSHTDHKTPYLNGGLFEAQPDDWRGSNVPFPQGFFVRLYEHFGEFNFTTDESTPDYEQIAIDPEMLGKIFENLLAEINEDTGEQARKARGAFYTPREIVAYMCRESVREYLYTATKAGEKAKIAIDKLLDTSDSDWAKSGTNSRRDTGEAALREKVIEALDEMKVLDPACGSGAFPIGMLHLLVQLYERLDGRFDAYKTKLGIMERNIYGVDIEPLAIEIARLRSFLALVVDQEYLDKKPNGGIDTLPNLEFKFVCANTLIPLTRQSSFTDGDKYRSLLEIKREYFRADPKEREKLERKYNSLRQQSTIFDSHLSEQLQTYDPFNNGRAATFYDQHLMHDVTKAFSVVIGNPPYVSTKNRSDQARAELQLVYGFVDDLYNHFFVLGFSLLGEKGVISFITSKTFWTIQTKRNLRQLLLDNRIIILFDTASPFSAMVDTCVVVAQKTDAKDEAYDFAYLDGKMNLSNPTAYTAHAETYRRAVNSVFFVPTPSNQQIYDRYNNVVKKLHTTWWDKIKTSKDISKNEAVLVQYRNSLLPGDIALLGTLTEGGQGLATANNGRFVGVRENTPEAKRVTIVRAKKFFDAITTKAIKGYSYASRAAVEAAFATLSEVEVWSIFDQAKEKFGRDVFGQGFIYRAVPAELVADVTHLTAEEKIKGIESPRCYVPYDKGDKDGNRWWLETPYVIDWSVESVAYLSTNSKARWQGHQFYFRDGFCWTDVNSTYLKARLKANGVFDVLSMSLFSRTSLPDWYFVCMINSSFISEYVSDFINSTSHFQINDARQLPIVIPTNDQLQIFKEIFDTAYEIKHSQFSGGVESEVAQAQLRIIQKRLDTEVLKLYKVESLVTPHKKLDQ